MNIVIIAGGRGERFWPRSTRNQPKQFHRIVGGRTMIQETFQRVFPDIPADRILVVAGLHLKEIILEQLPDLEPSSLLVEPEGRNTAPAIGLAAAWVHRFKGDEIMAVLSSDHLIEPREQFLDALRTAAAAAEQGRVVVFGMPPTRPATEYGYLEVGPEPLKGFDSRVLPVIRFLEKPSYETAHKFVESGRYLWNSGMFIFRAGVLLDAMAEHMPRLRQGLERIEQALGTPREAEVMQAEYPHFEKTSIDYGIMEKLDNLACVSPGFTWDDVGSWGSLARHVEADGQGNVVQGKTVLIDAAENLVAGDDESLIAAVGVSGLIVVKEGNRVLICRRDQDQRVKELLKEIDGDPKLRRFL